MQRRIIFMLESESKEDIDRVYKMITSFKCKENEKNVTNPNKYVNISLICD